MSSIRDPRGDSFMNSIDSTGTMVSKAAPAVVGTSYSLANLPLADIAAACTILYTCLLIFDWIWKKIKAYREYRRLNP